jgi:hypothetical protein
MLDRPPESLGDPAQNIPSILRRRHYPAAGERRELVNAFHELHVGCELGSISIEEDAVF